MVKRREVEKQKNDAVHQRFVSEQADGAGRRTAGSVRPGMRDTGRPVGRGVGASLSDRRFDSQLAALLATEDSQR